MTRRLVLLLFALVLGRAQGAQESAVPLETFTLSLMSKARPETGDYLVILRNRTKTHLEKKISEEISIEALGDDSYEFNHVELLMKALTLDKVSGNHRLVRRELDESAMYLSKATFEGSAFFASDHAPDESILYDIQLQAFSGVSKRALMNEIRDESDTPFLANAQDLTFTFGAVPSGQNLNLDSETSDNSDTDRSSFLPLIIGVGAGLFLLIIGAIFWHLRRRPPSSTLSAEDSRREIETDFGKIEINSTRSPSPPPSISSMDSSKFTYNDAGGSSLAGGTFKSAKQSTKSSKSTNNTIDLNINVDAWKNAQEASGNVTFEGEDISMIQKNEETMCTQASSNQIRKMLPDTSTASTEDTSYLSEDRLSKLGNKTKFQNHSAKYHGRLRPKASGVCRPSNFCDESIFEDEAGVSVETSDSDVINDLKNLSVQINRHRSG